MIIIGLAGKAGSGKSAVADYLVRRYGFIRFSFSDALYREVATAFGLPDESLLRDRETKEVETELLSLVGCRDREFADLCAWACSGGWGGSGTYLDEFARRRSPREVLQLWGTQYRRAQDPDYWIKRAEEWLEAVLMAAPYPELRPQLFVNDSVRFENERDWIKDPDGNVWHLRRYNAAPVHAHESENELPVRNGEREIFNNHTLEYLHKGVDQLLSSNARFVRMEPPAPMTEPQFPDFDNLDG